MRSLVRVGVFSAASCLFMWGCGDDPKKEPLEEGRCGAPTYLAFDPLNHEPQDRRLAAFDEMLEKVQEAIDDPSKAPSIADAVQALYEDPGLKISQKVNERKDVTFPDALLGAELHEAFSSAIEMLRQAETAQEVKLAKQWLEKAGMYRFLYHSVLYELYEGTKKNYDEAYGYLGTGQGNLPAGRKGLARLATKRDAENDTSLAEELFDKILDGACEVERAEGAILDSQSYLHAATSLDGLMQRVFAYSLGHELKGLTTLQGQMQAAEIKLWEAEGFFLTLERRLLAGTEAEADLATALRGAIEQAKILEDWVSSFPAQDLLDRLEATFGIRVKK